MSIYYHTCCWPESRVIHKTFRDFSTLSDIQMILGSHLANERRRYKVTPSLIGWAQT